MSRLYNSTVSGAASRIMQYKGDTYIALNPTVKPKKKKKIKARKKGATTLAEARRSKHIGSEGEVAYGKPMK